MSACHRDSGWYNCCTICSLGWGGTSIAQGGILPTERWGLRQAHRGCCKKDESSREMLIRRKKGRSLIRFWMAGRNRSPASEEDRRSSSTKQTCYCSVLLELRQSNRDWNYSTLVYLSKYYYSNNSILILSLWYFVHHLKILKKKTFFFFSVYA